MNWLLVAVNLLLVAVYVGFSSYWVDSTSDWWMSLRKPVWQPPNWVFGAIWPYNFLMLCIAPFVIREQTTQLTVWTMWFAQSVAASVWWGYEFYRKHNFKNASAALFITALSTYPMMIVMWKQNITMFWMLMPYQLWLVTAWTLCVGLNRLNPKAKSI